MATHRETMLAHSCDDNCPTISRCGNGIFFIHEYFSVDAFWKTYRRRIESLDDKSMWPKVTIADKVGAPLGKWPN